jgi:hypothetical protein
MGKKKKKKRKKKVGVNMLCECICLLGNYTKEMEKNSGLLYGPKINQSINQSATDL